MSATLSVPHTDFAPAWASARSWRYDLRHEAPSFPQHPQHGWLTPEVNLLDRPVRAKCPLNFAISKAVEYVRLHLSEVFGVEALLLVTGTPRRTLELAFRQSLGCTPYEFITRTRLLAAKDLLTGSRSLSLTEIATECGFSDLRRFRLVFRRECGMTPAEYRAHHLAVAGR